MTNNTDIKAPDRIWANAGSYPNFDDSDWCNASCSNQIEFGEEYTRTSSITPQQAAKVLLESISREDPILQSHHVIKTQLRMVGEGVGPVEAWLKALSETDQ